MTFLSPFVYWAQNEENLFLKVDLKDAKVLLVSKSKLKYLYFNFQEPKIKVQARKLSFQAKGYGAQGFNDYAFNIDFHSELRIAV